MAASLNEIKQRIASTKKTSQITKAMQMVSAAKLTKSEAHSKQFQVYANKVREIVTHLTAQQLSDLAGSGPKDGVNYNSMLVSRPVKRTGYIVITSDGGLVGGYNSSILKQMMTMLDEDHAKEEEYVMIAIGATGADFFKARGINLAYELRNLSDQPSFDEVRKIVTLATTMYQAILNQLLPQYAESLIYGAIVDAKTAEHAAGMTAMKTATDNAKNIIGDLTISYNRARQGAITQEITEIVAGASALE